MIRLLAENTMIIRTLRVFRYPWCCRIKLSFIGAIAVGKTDNRFCAGKQSAGIESDIHTLPEISHFATHPVRQPTLQSRGFLIEIVGSGYPTANETQLRGFRLDPTR